MSDAGVNNNPELIRVENSFLAARTLKRNSHHRRRGGSSSSSSSSRAARGVA